MFFRVSDDGLVNPDVSDRCRHLSQLNQVVALYVEMAKNLLGTHAHTAQSKGERREKRERYF